MSGGARASDRQGCGDRRIPHPEDHLLRRLCIGDGRLCRSDPARHHLSRALGLHLAARPADLEADGAGGCDPPAGGRARPRRARRSRACCSISARGSACPACTDDGAPRYPGGYPDYIVNHERSPGIGPLAGWRGADGEACGRGAPNPKQLERYIENGCHWFMSSARARDTIKHANGAYLEWAAGMGFIGRPEPIDLPALFEPLQKFRLAAQGHGAMLPPEQHRERIEKYFDPIPFWYPPFEGAGDAANFRSTPSPSGRWRCIIPGDRRMPGSARSRPTIGSICRERRARAGHRRRRLGVDHKRPSAASRRRSS